MLIDKRYHHSIDSISSLVNSSSYVFTLIFSRQPILVSKANISTIIIAFAPKKRPAKFIATMFAFEDPSGFSIFLSPKCRISYC